MTQKTKMKKYHCLCCGFVFNEATGDLESGIIPATLWQELPINWHCPGCKAIKDDFESMDDAENE